MTPPDFFWSGPFTQWHPRRFMLDGVAFNCAEQAMIHAKALLFQDPATAARILAATDPGAQKAIGQQVKAFDAARWDTEKITIVRRINLAKFGQNKGLRRKLFQTGDAVLAEASPMDAIWGIGLDAATAVATDLADWLGQNLPGRTLTEVRDTLAREYPAEARACAPAGTGVLS